MHCHKKNYIISNRPSHFKNSRRREDIAASQPDKALINERILTQLDALDKRLTAIEKSSASAGLPARSRPAGLLGQKSCCS